MDSTTYSPQISYANGKSICVSDVVKRINKIGASGYDEVLLFIDNWMDQESKQHQGVWFLRTDVDWMDDVDFANIFSEYIKTRNLHMLIRRMLDLLYMNNRSFLKYCLTNMLTDMMSVCCLVDPDASRHMGMFFGAVCVAMVDLEIFGADPHISRRERTKLDEMWRYYQQVHNEILKMISQTKVYDEIVKMMFLKNKLPIEYLNIDKIMLFAIEHDYKHNKDLDRAVRIYDKIHYSFSCFFPQGVTQEISQKIAIKDTYIFDRLLCRCDDSSFLDYITLDSAVAMNIVVEKGKRYIKELLEDVPKNAHIFAKILLSLYSILLKFHQLVKECVKNKQQITSINRYSVLFLFDFYKDYVNTLSNLCITDRQILISAMTRHLSSVSIDTLPMYQDTIHGLAKSWDCFDLDYSVTLFIDIVAIYCAMPAQQINKNVGAIKRFVLMYYDPDRRYNLIPKRALVKCYTDIVNSKNLIAEKRTMLNLLTELYWFEFDTRTKLLFYKKGIDKFTEWLMNLKTSQIDEQIIQSIILDIFDLVAVEEFDLSQTDGSSNASLHNRLTEITKHTREIYMNTKSLDLKNHIKNTVTQHFKRFAVIAPFDKDGKMSYRCCKIIHDIFPDISQKIIFDVYQNVLTAYTQKERPKTYKWIYSLPCIKDKAIKDTLVINEHKNPVDTKTQIRVVEDEQRCFVCMGKASHKFKEGCNHGVCATCFNEWYIVGEKAHKCGVCKKDVLPKF